MANIATYGWAGADCSIGAAGSGTFIPNPAVGDSIFWVIVGNNTAWEGTYGLTTSGAERPPNTANASACFRPQNLAPVCE